MSGPKTSSYQLSPAQRRALMEQAERERQIRLEQERILKMKKKSAISTIRVQCYDVQILCEEIGTLAERIAHISDKGDRVFSNEIDECKRAIESATEAFKLDEEADLEILQKEAGKITVIKNRLKNHQKIFRRELNEEESQAREQMGSAIELMLGLDFSGITNRSVLRENKYHEKIQMALGGLSIDRMTDEMIKRLDELREKATHIKSVDYLESFYNVSVQPFVRDCKEYMQLYEKYGENYEALVLRYELLSSELGKEIRKVPFGEDCIDELLELISELEAEDIKRREDEYIHQCIDEAMREMNYRVIGSRSETKKNGKTIKHALYHFEDGVVVNVIKTNEGQITMELGGADVEDRIPSEEEAMRLTENMRVFCDDYQILEEKLRAKGIESKRIMILPPETRYAQIINITDYDTDQPIETINISKKKRDGAALRRMVNNNE